MPSCDFLKKTKSPTVATAIEADAATTCSVGKGSGLESVAVGVGETVGAEAVGEGKFAPSAGEVSSGVAVGFMSG